MVLNHTNGEVKDLPEVEISSPRRSPINEENPSKGGESYELTLEKAKSSKKDLSLGTPRGLHKTRTNGWKEKDHTTPKGSVKRSKALTPKVPSKMGVNGANLAVTPSRGSKSPNSASSPSYYSSSTSSKSHSPSSVKNSSLKEKSSNELKVTATAKDQLSCVGCKKVCGGPLVRCRQSHILCSRCAPRHKTCPTQEDDCAYDMWFPHAATEMEKRLKRYKQMSIHCTQGDCTYQGRVWQYLIHEKVCDYQPIACPIYTCYQTVQRNELTQHFHQAHSAVTADMGPQQLDQDVKMTFHMTKFTARAFYHDWISPYFTIQGMLFLLRFIKRDGQYFVWAQQMNRLNCGYECHVSFQGPRLQLGYRAPVFEVGRSVKSLTLEPECLQIGPEIMEQLWIEHKNPGTSSVIDRSVSFHVKLTKDHPCP
ncbi:hypothetical protein TCAL_14346 [Tigriopus californicus]|uniref:RING-type E3 ubiquitin transferase n=1 Tax=Tigriopus californicus TaxID=6832 RepID=A0A553NAP7_TIGCA|nr:hypothetical protein TCAL_14346 [Tigriopus californicus]